METHTAWKILAYVAAARRGADGNFEPLTEAVTNDPIWVRMVGQHWQSFLAILATVPPGTERIQRAALSTAVGKLASEFQAWLETIGYRFVDDDDGTSQFHIVQWDLF